MTRASEHVECELHSALESGSHVYRARKGQAQEMSLDFVGSFDARSGQSVTSRELNPAMPDCHCRVVVLRPPRGVL